MTPPRPPKNEDERKGFQTAIRLTGAELARVDGLVQAMSDATGVEVTRSAAMRAAMTAGFDVLEERLGLSKRKTKR